MAFIKKSYQQIIDDALVKIRGGVVNESHTFVEDEQRYILDNAPVDTIILVKGVRNGQSYSFSQGEQLDFYLAGGNSIQWIGATPDDKSEFFVSYLPQHRDSPITDTNIGSVTRTLIEAFSWEVTVLYNQLNIVYENAFIDTAKGKSLDFLVKLLDITRIEPGYAVGEVTFLRNTPAPADIPIPKGTLAGGVSIDEAGAEIAHVYKTAEDTTLRRGETSVSVPVRSEVKGVSAPAGALHAMPKPILGIEEITNHDATVVGSQQEDDDQLRERAKSRIKGTSTGTREAILTSLLEKDFVTSADVIDRPDGSNGEITVVLDTSRPEVEGEVKDRLHAIKAAGVFFNLVFTKKVFPTYKLTLKTSTDVSESAKQEIEEQLQEKARSYLVELRPSATVVASKILSIAMEDPKIESAQITDVRVSPESSDVKCLPNNDLSIGKYHKATATDEIDPLEVTFLPPAAAQVPPPAVEVSGQQLQVEAHIFIKLYDPSLGELKAKKAIEAKTRSYLSNLFAEDGDCVDFKDFIEAVKTLKPYLKAEIYVGRYVIKVSEDVPSPPPAAEADSPPLPEQIASLEKDAEAYTFLRLVHSADGLERILLSKSHKEQIRTGEIVGEPKIFIYVDRDD